MAVLRSKATKQKTRAEKKLDQANLPTKALQYIYENGLLVCGISMKHVSVSVYVYKN